MDSLQLGNLAISVTPNGLRLALQNNAKSIELANEQLASLRAFLDQYENQERRVGFRVPLRPLSGAVRDAFEVVIKHHAHEYDAQAVDLSLTGILVESLDHSLADGEHITVKLCLNRDCVFLNANVVRSEGKMIALHFPTCIKNGELDPPDTLLNIYRALELEWLKSRVHA